MAAGMLYTHKVLPQVVAMIDLQGKQHASLQSELVWICALMWWYIHTHVYYESHMCTYTHVYIYIYIYKLRWLCLSWRLYLYKGLGFFFSRLVHLGRIWENMWDVSRKSGQSSRSTGLFPPTLPTRPTVAWGFAIGGEVESRLTFPTSPCGGGVGKSFPFPSVCVNSMVYFTHRS